MKKFISIILASGMILSSTGALAKEITVDEAVEYALENSLEFAKKEAEIAANKYTSYDASKTQKNLRKNPFLEVNSFDTYLVLQGYYADASKLALTVAERAEADLRVSTANSVKNDFYTYLNSVRSVELAEENLSISEENLHAAKQRRESGTISELDFKSFELAYNGAENAVSSARRTRDFNLQKLKNTINYKEEDELVPVGEFVYAPSEPVPFEVAIEKSRSGNTYLNLKDSLALAEKRWYWAYRHYNASVNAYKVEKASYDQAQADFSINVNNFDLNIRNVYNSLLSLNEQIQYMTEYADYLKATADSMYLRYEMGLVTAKDYRQVQQEYFTAQNDLNQLELTYVVTNMSYEALFKSGTEDTVNE